MAMLVPRVDVAALLRQKLYGIHLLGEEQASSLVHVNVVDARTSRQEHLQSPCTPRPHGMKERCLASCIGMLQLGTLLQEHGESGDVASTDRLEQSGLTPGVCAIHLGGAVEEIPEGAVQ